MMGRRSFTLVELLAATALAGVLMVAVLSVTASLTGPRRMMTPAAERAGDWEAALRQLLRHDVEQARHVEVEDGVVILDTLAHLEPRDAAQAHRPVRVWYAYEQGAGVLIREQLDLLEPTNRARSIGLLAAGVAGFEAQLSAGGEDEPVIEGPGAGDAAPPPAELRVRVRLQGQTHAGPIEVRVGLR